MLARHTEKITERWFSERIGESGCYGKHVNHTACVLETCREGTVRPSRLI